MESSNEDQRPTAINRNDDAGVDEDSDYIEDSDHNEHWDPNEYWSNSGDWEHDKDRDQYENRDIDEDRDNNIDDDSRDGFILRAATALSQLSTKDIECGPQEPNESDEAYQQRVQDAKDLKADLEASKLVAPLY